ncbi:MAG TPA: RDD family protein [Saprospiraceae bacterium]|nr:RDD family protein [Saprospiraceae bacterium]
MKNHYIISQNIIANKGLRFANYLIDLILILVLVFVLTSVFVLLSDIIGYDAEPIISYIGEMNKLEEHLFGLLFTIPYYIFMEVMTGRTIGKYLTGTIVVDHEGNKPNLETIIKRSFCRAIPFNALSFLGEKSRGWHDSISETYVVITKELEKEKQNYIDFNEIGKKESEFENDFNV